MRSDNHFVAVMQERLKEDSIGGLVGIYKEVINRYGEKGKSALYLYS